MKVVQFDKDKKQDDSRKNEIIAVLAEIKRQVDAGELVEFVAASMRSDGSLQLHAACYDIPTAVGMFEVGKHMLIEDSVG